MPFKKFNYNSKYNAYKKNAYTKKEKKTESKEKIEDITNNDIKISDNDSFKKKGDYIGNRGYSLIKDNYSQAELNNIRRELTVKPFVNKQFSQESQPFPVYLESKKKLYIPKYYGISNFGKPLIDKTSEGKDIDIEFKFDLRPKQVPVAEKFLE